MVKKDDDVADDDDDDDDDKEIYWTLHLRGFSELFYEANWIRVEPIWVKHFQCVNIVTDY